MKRFLLLLCFVSFLRLVGCKNDSDFLMGTYNVTTRVKLSSCPEDFFVFFDDIGLPTGFVHGQESVSFWSFERVGVTATGGDRLHIKLFSLHARNYVFTLSGVLDDGILQLTSEQDFTLASCDLHRHVYGIGGMGDTGVFGDIHTIITYQDPLHPCPSLELPAFSCEVSEEFSGTL